MDIPQEIIEGVIQRGDILLSTFEGIDHQKFFAVMGVSEDRICGFFFINSNINRFIYNKPELLKLQYPMRHQDYDFLRYDSFLCASSVIERSVSSISEEIRKGTAKIIGRMKEAHIQDVIEMALESEVISKRDKELYFK